jgi:hypothetical protein
MKTITHLKQCAVAVLLVGFGSIVIAADRYSTIAGIVAVWEANLEAGEVWEAEFTSALNGATDAQLADIQNATSYDAVRAILQGRDTPAQLEGVAGTEALGSLTSDLVFTPVVPCRFFDTRNDSDTASIGHTRGPTATIRSYQVYGDATTMQNQGGTVACPAPNGEPVGISANLTAAPLENPSTGKGNIRAYPFGGTLPDVSLVNYEAGTNIANAAIVATCYICGFDLNVATQFHSSASIGDVMGYFYPAIIPVTTYAIGDTGPAGGWVFHITDGGLHGLEAAPVDQSAGALWGCFGTLITGADGSLVGTGAQNTGDIVTWCMDAGIAARIANNYSSNGFNDWFLPSFDELNLMYLNIGQGSAPPVNIGGFAPSSYWSSSEFNGDIAVYQAFTSGFQGGSEKNFPRGVRAIRAF